MNNHIWTRILSIVSVLLLFMTMTPITGQAAISGVSEDLPTTGFEERKGDGWTTLEEELEFIKEVAEKSDRVSYSQVGTSVEGRPFYMVRVGFPGPPSDEDIAAGRSLLIMGTPHGNEPAGREMALKKLRDLAFTEDQELIDQLSESTVLFIPTPNPDGREANTRGNAWGLDNNRDHLKLETPEIQAIAKVMKQFNPDITVDAHERPRDSGDPDVEMLWPRNLNVDEQLRDLNIEMVEDYLIPDVEEAGFTTGLYGTPPGSGSGSERILRNMGGLRHGLSLLVETPGKADPVDRVDMHMRTVESVLEFYRERMDDVDKVVNEAPQRKADAGANQEKFYLDGTHDWDQSDWVAMDPAPIGYLLNNSQVGKISQHIKLFPLETEPVGDHGEFITMNQEMMTVVPLLVDEGAAYNEVAGLALYDSSNPGSAENMKSQVEHFENEGEFANEEAASSLKMHLTAVDHFEKQDKEDKVIKHMKNFKLLLGHQKENELISEKAFNNLESYSDYLIEKWDINFDSERAMEHLRHLSVDLGPRVAGSEAEKQASEYIKDEFESLGFDVSTQGFDIRGDKTSQNVIAVKKPKDNENADIIYVTSHYDSVPGSPGANDNGSGTSTLLELARVMKNLPTNKEIRLVAFGAEEIGLVGAKYYVDQLSEEEVNRSVGNFNMDMVGTNWEPATQLYVNVVDGKPNKVWNQAKSAAEKLNNNTLFLYKRGSSDHVAFHEAGIDAANFIWREPGTAALEPYYHTPQDTIEHISPERIQMVGDLINTAVSDLSRESESNKEQKTSLEEAS